MMVQRYTFLHKINGNENISVLNFIKSNNLKVLLPNFLLPKLKKMVTETLRFQIIFVTLRQNSKH
nr:MAG TPA: hypothetical protein [Caudoviricetes sp.]